MSSPTISLPMDDVGFGTYLKPFARNLVVDPDRHSRSVVYLQLVVAVATRHCAFLSLHTNYIIT